MRTTGVILGRWRRGSHAHDGAAMPTADQAGSGAQAAAGSGGRVAGAGARGAAEGRGGRDGEGGIGAVDLVLLAFVHRCFSGC